MIERFSGERGLALLVEELHRQSLTAGMPELSQALAEAGTLEEVKRGRTLIEQGDDGTDIYFIIAGSFGIFANQRRVNVRRAGVHVGEMGAVSVQRRAATVVAEEDGIVLKVSESNLSQLADRFPIVWRRIAQELCRRLDQRNALIRLPNEKIRVFVISSAEALPVARELEIAFAHDPFLTVVWAHGVFRVTNYTLESLEDELDRSDFAIAIAHPDDKTTVRNEDWPTPRDNVVFELGFFMGRLGRKRAILMEPRLGTKLKLPSDLAGITTIRYNFEEGSDAQVMMGPACHELRKHIMALGRNV
jgi:predicted nucleotide-binding protein